MRIRALLAYISTCVTPRAERLGAGPHLDDRRDHRLKSRGEGESGGGAPAPLARGRIAVFLCCSVVEQLAAASGRGGGVVSPTYPLPLPPPSLLPVKREADLTIGLAVGT